MIYPFTNAKRGKKLFPKHSYAIMMMIVDMEMTKKDAVIIFFLMIIKIIDHMFLITHYLLLMHFHSISRNDNR